MKKVKITVMRMAKYADLSEKYENPITHTCDLHVGQEFIANGYVCPDGFCASAWESIAPFVLTLSCGGEDIAAQRVGLLLIAVGIGKIPLGGIQGAQHRVSLLPFPDGIQSHRAPDRGVGVLPAVFAEARRIALHVSRVRRAVMKRRRFFTIKASCRTEGCA